MTLKGKIAIVTGASSGIGRAIAQPTSSKAPPLSYRISTRGGRERSAELRASRVAMRHARRHRSGSGRLQAHGRGRAQTLRGLGYRVQQRGHRRAAGAGRRVSARRLGQGDRGEPVRRVLRHALPDSRQLKSGGGGRSSTSPRSSGRSGFATQPRTSPRSTAWSGSPRTRRSSTRRKRSA